MKNLKKKIIISALATGVSLGVISQVVNANEKEEIVNLRVAGLSSEDTNNTDDTHKCNDITLIPLAMALGAATGVIVLKVKREKKGE